MVRRQFVLFKFPAWWAGGELSGTRALAVVWCATKIISWKLNKMQFFAKCENLLSVWIPATCGFPACPERRFTCIFACRLYGTFSILTHSKYKTKFHFRLGMLNPVQCYIVNANRCRIYNKSLSFSCTFNILPPCWANIWFVQKNNLFFFAGLSYGWAVGWPKIVL